MPTAESVPAIPAGYPIEVRPLSGRSPRSDWDVGTAAVTASAHPSPIERPDFIARLREFFADMDSEIDRHVHDPIATAQALARIEALMADVRYLRDRLKSTTAESMNTHLVRRLTIAEVVTLEASSTINRTNWQTAELMRLVLDSMGLVFVDSATGEIRASEQVVDDLCEYFRAEWRLTPLRNIGIEPDDFCTVERDEDGKVVRTPTVTIKDNRIRAHKAPTATVVES